tara:strand:+ start:244 stop:501 length:258 start_codon:yes stop_codon:yes gene_type:complete
MNNLNLLGGYIWKRIQKDNPIQRNTHAREYLTGLYINANDIQRYIYDYFTYGIDYTGDDNISAEDKLDKTDLIERYWDFPEGKEE